MQTEPRTNGKGKGKSAKARLDADKQEVVQKPKIVVEKMDELVRLKHAADRAGENFSDAIKKAAEDSGYLASVVRSIVVAKAGDDFDEKKRRCEQQMELFDEV